MSWREFFYGIQDIGEALLIDPFDKLRAFELENWWGANLLNWVFLLILIVALTYWMLEIKKYNDLDNEDREAKAHGFLGKDSDLESRH